MHLIVPWKIHNKLLLLLLLWPQARFCFECSSGMFEYCKMSLFYSYKWDKVGMNPTILNMSKSFSVFSKNRIKSICGFFFQKPYTNRVRFFKNRIKNACHFSKTVHKPCTVFQSLDLATSYIGCCRIKTFIHIAK